MEFVKVRAADGREADITPGEVDAYAAMGFARVSDTAPLVRTGTVLTPATGPLGPANGTDERLDLILAELRGLRSDLAGAWQPLEPSTADAPADGEPIELREPVVDRTAMTRDELNAYAATVGIADPASYPNKAELLAAIAAMESNSA